VDTDGNALVDSFFVDFNYLGRNSCINGMAAAVAASGPLTPDFTCSYAEGGKIAVSIAGEGSFRVGIRTLSNDWDSVYTISQAQDTIEVSAAAKYYVSVAAIGQHGMESLFSKEITLSPTGIPKKNESADIELLPNRPNPFDESTIISLFAGPERTWKSAILRITDASGKLLSEIPLDLHEGLNEVWYEHGYQVQGVLDCTLMLDGKPFSSRKMVFAN
jgi:hypothetical protein